MSATIFVLHFFPSCLKAVGLGLRGARQFPVIVRNVTVQGFQAHTCMRRGCFYAPSATILWLKDNSLAFLYFVSLVDPTSALIIFICAAREMQSAYKTAISLSHCEICLPIWIMFIIVAAKKAAEHSCQCVVWF